MKFSFSHVVFALLASVLLLAGSLVAQNPSNPPSSTTDGSPAMAASPNTPSANAPVAQTSVSTTNGKKVSDDRDANLDISAPAPSAPTSSAPASSAPASD